MATLTQSIKVEFDIINDEISDIVEEEVFNLHNDLVDKGKDVYDTGNFERSFAPIQKLGTYSWKILNDASYASILARGRRMVGGRAYGSLKWAKGIDPMLSMFNKTIEKRTDALRA